MPEAWAMRCPRDSQFRPTRPAVTSWFCSGGLDWSLGAEVSLKRHCLPAQLTPDKKKDNKLPAGIPGWPRPVRALTHCCRENDAHLSCSLDEDTCKLEPGRSWVHPCLPFPSADFYLFFFPVTSCTRFNSFTEFCEF